MFEKLYNFIEYHTCTCIEKYNDFLKNLVKNYITLQNLYMRSCIL